tara:strand:+ start:37 stop:558 length:522 start_codon:yes stop_codon:yes gene_type:complete
MNNIPKGVSREILHTGSPEDMLQLEYNILNKAFDSGNWDSYYNIVRSYPNFSHVPIKTHTDQAKAKMCEKRQIRHLRGNTNHMYGVKHSEESKAKMQASTNAYYENNPGAMLGKKHSEETKAKMRKSAKPWTAEHRAKAYAPSVTCKHCEKFVTKSHHTRWHGNNCKSLKLAK